MGTRHQRKRKTLNGTSRSRLNVYKLKDPQLAGTLATLNLSGMNWLDGTQQLYCQAKETMGVQKHKAAYWVYDNKEVEPIVAERKAVNNSRDQQRCQTKVCTPEGQMVE